MTDFSEFQRVKAIVSLRQYVTHELGPEHKNGGWRCPFHEDKSPSFSVKGKAFKCFSGSCGLKGDIYAFIGERHGVTAGEALNMVKQWANITDDMPTPQHTTTKADKKPAKKKALPDGWRHFIFQNADGEEVGAECRLDTADGKRTLMYHKDPDGFWISTALDEPRPLYHLPDMVNAKGPAPLYVVEGAKCAEAVIAAGQRATTWMGGTNAIHLTDFAPLIEAGKSAPVVLISDGDAPGRKAMRKIRKQLVAGGLVPQFYAMGGVKGFDIADLLKAHKGNWDVAFPILQARCPNPDELPPIIADDILDDIRDNKEFAVLGYQQSSIVVVRKPTGKVVHLPSKVLNDGHMTEICPAGYFWTQLFESSGATLKPHPRREAHRALTIVSEERGLWQPRNQTGRGLVHIPGEGYFFHMGDRVERVVQKKGQKPFGIGEMSSPQKVFTPRPPLMQRPHPCRPQEFKLLNDELNDFSWRNQFGGTLMLAWVCAALIGGATYRPHLRLVSRPDMGKNWLMDTAILPILGDMYNDGGGDASAAGISAKAKGDALPFIINEANPNSKQMKAKMADLQQLMLGAYDEAGTPILRATQDGEMREAYVRSSFLLASNQVVDESEANASRTFQLSMTGKLGDKEFRELEKRVNRAVESYAPGIRGLMMARAEIILKDLPLAKTLIQDEEALEIKGRESRNVALLAACHANLYPHDNTNKNAQIIISARQIVAAMGQRVKIKDSIIEAIVSMREQNKGHSVKEAWVASHEPNADKNKALQDALSNLRTAGVFIEQVNLKKAGPTECLFVNPESAELRNHLNRDQKWAGVDVPTALDQETGSFRRRRRYHGKIVDAFVVPLSWKLEDDEIPKGRPEPFVSPNIKTARIVEIDR